MSAPKFSIITVVYNGESLLEGTMQSVINQTYTNIEFIVLDGASKDNTAAVAAQYKSHIDIWKSEPDKGIYDAMNKALHLATGDFVLFLNCGDHLHASDTLQRVADQYTPETDVLYGDVMMVDDARKHIGTMPEITPHQLPAQLNWRSMKYGMNVCHQSIFIRRNIAPDYIMGNLAADIDWCIKSLKVARKTQNVGIIISDYLVGGISKQRYRQSMKDRYEVLRTHFGLIPNLWNHFVIVLRAVWFKWQQRGRAQY